MQDKMEGTPFRIPFMNLTGGPSAQATAGGDSFSDQQLAANVSFDHHQADKEEFKFPDISPPMIRNWYGPARQLDSPPSDAGRDIMMKIAQNIKNPDKPSPLPGNTSVVCGTFKQELDKIHAWREEMMKKLSDANFRADLLEKERQNQIETVNRLRQEGTESSRFNGMLKAENVQLTGRQQEISELTNEIKAEIKQLNDWMESFQPSMDELLKEGLARKHIQERVLADFNEFKEYQTNKVKIIIDILKTNEEDIERLKKLIDDARKELKTEQFATATTKNRIKEVEQKTEKLRIKYDTLDEHKKELESNLLEKDKEVKELMSKIADLRGQTKLLEGKVSQTMKMLNERTQEADQLKEDTFKTECDIEDKDTEIEGLNRSIEAAHSDDAAKEQKVTAVQAKISALQADLDKTEEAKKRLSSNFTAVQEELNVTGQNLSAAKKRAHKKAEERKKLEAKRDELDGTIEEARNQSMVADEEHSRAIQNLSVSISQVTIDLRKETTEKTSLEKKVLSLEERVAQAEAELRSTNLMLNKVQGEVVTHQTLKRQSEERNKDLKQKCQQLEQSMREVTESHLMRDSPRIHVSLSNMEPRTLFNQTTNSDQSKAKVQSNAKTTDSVRVEEVLIDDSDDDFVPSRKGSSSEEEPAKKKADRKRGQGAAARFEHLKNAPKPADKAVNKVAAIKAKKQTAGAAQANQPKRAVSNRKRLADALGWCEMGSES